MWNHGQQWGSGVGEKYREKKEELCSKKGRKSSLGRVKNDEVGGTWGGKKGTIRDAKRITLKGSERES